MEISKRIFDLIKEGGSIHDQMMEEHSKGQSFIITAVFDSGEGDCKCGLVYCGEQEILTQQLLQVMSANKSFADIILEAAGKYIEEAEKANLN